jgi:signal transduction histidine kinase
MRTYAAARLPVDAETLGFRIRSNLPAAEEPARIQFRLEGWDEEWRDIEAFMWLSVGFLDEDGQRISGTSLPRTGRSSGWTGDPNTSRFRVASETVIPPPRARKLQLTLGSGGGGRSTGIWLVKRLRVSVSDGPGATERILLEERVEHGSGLDQPQGVPTDWRREGSNPGAPQVFTFSSPAAVHALALIDTDSRTTGRWVGSGRNLVPVEPGRPVRIETEEAFSIGSGGAHAWSYSKLPAGRYVFQAIPVDEFGVQAGIGVQLPVVLVPPFYSSWWFWTAVTLAGAAALTGGVRYLTWKRLQHELERSERRHAIEQERMRIAQDIHDDMGARLTQISLVSRLALRNTPADSPSHPDLARLDRAAREVAIALDEIVWAVNPAHDTLEGLGNYISQYVTEIVAESAVRCRLDIPALLPARFISSGVRHHLLMAVKEALNNVLKHSGATEVRVQLSFVDPMVSIVIADNGRGFDPAPPSAGNGIANMKRRLHSVGGTCTVQSAAGQGTTVTLAINLSLEPPGP